MAHVSSSTAQPVEQTWCKKHCVGIKRAAIATSIAAPLIGIALAFLAMHYAGGIQTNLGKVASWMQQSTPHGFTHWKVSAAVAGGVAAIALGLAAAYKLKHKKAPASFNVFEIKPLTAGNLDVHNRSQQTPPGNDNESSFAISDTVIDETPSLDGLEISSSSSGSAPPQPGNIFGSIASGSTSSFSESDGA